MQWKPELFIFKTPEEYIVITATNIYIYIVAKIIYVCAIWKKSIAFDAGGYSLLLLLCSASLQKRRKFASSQRATTTFESSGAKKPNQIVFLKAFLRQMNSSCLFWFIHLVCTFEKWISYAT